MCHHMTLEEWQLLLNEKRRETWSSARSRSAPTRSPRSNSSRSASPSGSSFASEPREPAGLRPRLCSLPELLEELARRQYGRASAQPKEVLVTRHQRHLLPGS